MKRFTSQRRIEARAKVVRRIKILHLITGLNSGGAEMMLYKLLASYDRSRFEMQVISMTDGGLFAPRIESIGIPVTSLSMRRGAASASSVFRLVRLLQKYEPDVLQSWMYHADLLGLVGGKLARVPKISWNVRASDLDFEGGHRGLKRAFALHGMLARFPDAVVVNSVSGRNFHARMRHSAATWELIHNGFDTSRFRPDSAVRSRVREQLAISAKAVVIGLIARFDPQKDHGTFLSAASSLVQQVPDAVFVLAGKGVDEENAFISGAVDKYRLKASVRLLGEYSDTAELFPALDIMTLSSRNGEGLPNALGEAMSCGIPCVATDVGDAALLVGETGRIVSPGNAGAIARSWLDLISMGPAQRSKLGDAARKRICDNFEIGAIVARYEELYGRLAMLAH